MKTYIKPNTNIVLIQSEAVMQATSGGGQNSFNAELKNEGATGDVLGKKNDFSLWSDSDEEE